MLLRVIRVMIFIVFYSIAHSLSSAWDVPILIPYMIGVLAAIISSSIEARQ